MPTPGLSLVGFMDQAEALLHLEKACFPTNPSQAALLADWAAAKALLGTAVANAGNPNILPIPAAGQNHITQLSAQPWLNPYINDPANFVTGFALVEIAPLLAFQHVVNIGRSQFHGSAIASPPSLDELLNACLPISPAAENFDAFQPPGPPAPNLPSSFIIKSQSLNLRVMQGNLGPAGYANSFAGIFIGPGLPLVQVSNFNGRYYLSNGFHRAYCIAQLGATHIPCIVRSPPISQAVGIDRGTFDLSLLESANPPTVGHFINGRAYPVQLRRFSRIISVNWSQWEIPDE